MIHSIDLSLIHFDKMNTRDNYNDQTQQIQMNTNRKGEEKHSHLGTKIQAHNLCKSLNSTMEPEPVGSSVHPKHFPLSIFKEIFLLITSREGGSMRLIAGSSFQGQIKSPLSNLLPLSSEPLQGYCPVTESYFTSPSVHPLQFLSM